MSVSIEDIADKVHALWKVCRHVEVHQPQPQHRCRQIHICARDILDRIQDMSDEPGLELIIADANSALKHALQALRQWESISPYQAIVDESKFSSCLEVELRALGECDLHHVLGFEQQWKSAYVRAKERDEDDLVKKLVLLAEESSESNDEETKSKATSPPPVVPTFTVIEKVSLEGQPSSSTNRSHLAITPDAKASDMELKTLEREFYDCVHITSQYQPLLNPLELSPVVAPLAQELSTMTAGQSLSLGDDAAMLRVSHVPFVTISDINKMEDAHYLHNIRDLTLQIRLFSGHPMRRNGSIMTYLGSKIRDKFSVDTALEDTSLLQNHSGATLVSVRLCQAHPNDQMLYNMMQRRLLQEACIWSRLTHKNIVPFLGLSRYLKLGKTSILGLVSPWHERTLSDYVKVFPDINHMNLGAIFISEEGHPQIGCFSLCSKFELNAPLNLVIRLAGQSALRCMAPEYIRGRVSNLNMMLSADVWSLGMVVLQIFTHKTPFEGVPMPHGLVKFLVQGTTPVHPSENTTESLSVSRPQLKRKRSAPLPPMPASNSDALEAAAEAAAEAIPSEEEGHSVVKRGLSDEIWSLLQLCWKYDPSARPTMSEVAKRLKEITETCTIGVKDVTACVRKTTIYPVANGGQCDIYLGEFVTHPHEKVAMKRLRMFSNLQLEPVRKELMREVRLWCELVHPNILEFYGLYDAGGMSIYMISRWMSNGNAPDYLQKHPDANRRDIVSDSLSGLCYLHSLRILHGDLKGANILIKDDCTACLSDLGLARASHEATATSMRGNGSIRYMSPEILLTNDDSGVSKIPVKTLQSDVFAFGLVIRELLSDEIPYANIQSMPHVIRLIAGGCKPSRPDSDVAKEWLCDNMWEIVETTLESDPKARPIISEVSRRVSFVPVIKRFSPRRRISEPNPQKPRLQGMLRARSTATACLLMYEIGVMGKPTDPSSPSTEVFVLIVPTMAAQRHTVHALNQPFIIDAEYQFVKELGQGAYGCVLAAKHRRSGEGCAIKKITNIFTKRILTKRCLREIRLLHHFRGHKNITCLYDMDIVFDANGNFNEVYLYEELMEADLHAIIRSGQPLSDAHFQSFLYQTLCGLKYIHSANVLHRDLKPGNLLVNADCELKICDFGLARGYVAAGSDSRTAASGNQGFMTEYVATRWYRAPEIMLSFANYTTAIDVWSIGCILAELLGGKPIFKGRDYVDQLNQILHTLGTPSEDTLRRVGSPRAQDYIRSLPIKPRIPFSTLYPHANPLAIDLLGKLLAFDPAKRISCEEALSHPYLNVWHDPSDEPVCSSTFDFGFEEEDSVDGMRKLIVDEVNSFRAAVRNQARATSGAKQPNTLPVPSREDVINSPVVDSVPANGATSSYTRSNTGRAPSPVIDDPSEELARELEQRLAH